MSAANLLPTHPRPAVMLCLLAALALAAASAAPAADGAPGVAVTHLANEGFLIEAGETRVLVDALTGDGLRGYPAVPRPLRDELEGARGRFAGVDLILVSHYHADHFDAAAVARHLKANPAAVFLSTPQAVEELRAELGDDARGLEILAVHPAEGASARIELPGVEVEALNLHHGRGRPIENLALILRLGGLELLHVGDTVTAASDLEPYREQLRAVDVWLIPDWLLGEPAWQAARARADGETWLVAMHLPEPAAPPDYFGSAGSLEARVARIREALPEAWVPLEPLASRDYPPPP